jgi:predicted DNA-binding protein with PD1-like motif
MENYTFRLKSGQDLFEAIQGFADGKNIEARGFISPTLPETPPDFARPL